MVSGQGLPSVACDTKATTGFAVQLSASSITTNGSGNGAGPPGTVVVNGLDAVGLVVSSIVIVCVTVVVLLHASVKVHVLVIVPPQFVPTCAPSVPATLPFGSQLSV